MLKNCILISAVANKGLATATNVAGCLSNLAISRKIHAPSSSRSNELKSANHEQSEKLPDFSKVVICGGGVLGASVAYHLAELGWGKHTVVLEQGR